MSTTVYTHNEQGQRVDVHKPSSINPGDYEYIGVDEARKALKEGQKIAGPGGVCHHCGKAIVWRVHWRYLPTGDVVTFGYICTEILGMSNDRIEHEMVLLKRRAENERREEQAKMEREEKVEKFQAEHPDVAEFLNNLDEGETFEFLVDMKRSMEHWGSLTERQVESVKKCMVARQKYYAKKIEEAMNEPTEVLVEGRRVIEGEVINHKWVDNNYTGGRDHKMLVKQDDGNKVWGSVPRAISDYLYHNDERENRELKNMRVKFTATVEAKEDHFGYFKRPSNAEVL